jgi:hypothetical protein
MAALLQHPLREYLHLKAALGLIRLGGADPDAKGPPRRRSPNFESRPFERDLED